jgi:uncharacterized protein (TIGR03790 family)
VSKLALLIWAASLLSAQTAANVLLVVNQNSPLSRQIAEYYVLKRRIPAGNICRLNATTKEEISRDEFDSQIVPAITTFLKTHKLEEAILYIVTTAGLPLRIHGSTGELAEAAAVDSELAMLYSDMHGQHHNIPAGIANPFFGKIRATFRHPDFPIYLVTRLAGYDFDDVKGIIDRSLEARNRGKFVIDLKASDGTPGNRWLLEAARSLPQARVVLDQSAKVLVNQTDVIAYASWGSNDSDRHQRHLGFRWLPGAIMTEYVSTNGRTFTRPPDSWNLGSSWSDPAGLFFKSPQTLTADYIHDGATGASGHVYEPFLAYTPRPNILLPAYYTGRNLAESYYLSIPALSWMNIVIGDPLCTLGSSPW